MVGPGCAIWRRVCLENSATTVTAGVKGATALSQASIAGGAVSGVACLMTRRHPLHPSKSLIDYDLALMLAPVLLLGVSVGMSPLLPCRCGM